MEISVEKRIKRESYQEKNTWAGSKDKSSRIDL